MIESIQNLAPAPCSTGQCASVSDGQAQTPKTPLTQAADTVEISKQGRERLRTENGPAAGLPGETKIDPGQQKEVDELEQTDREVKAHERAHMAAGAGLVMGGANYQYQRGPNGKMYAVGGEVKIDTSRERDPKDTIRKMQQVKRAALAPSQPSGQDRSVAARASQIEAEARIELLKENAERTKQDDSTNKKPSGIISAAQPNTYQLSTPEPTIKVVA